MTSYEKEIMVKLTSLGTGFPGRVELAPFSAEAMKGELVSVVGFNGIGKSTLLRTIAGIQSKISGSFSIDGKPAAEMRRREFAGKVGYVSTEPVKVAGMKVFDLVSLGRYNHTNWFGNLTTEDKSVVYLSIERAGLAGFHHRNIDELSDGERQRAMIARVLAQDTPLMIMDEPTAFLDIRNRNEIIHLMHSLAADEGKTVIISTHDLQSAISESDRIWLMTQVGITEGAPEDLVLDGSFDAYFGNSSLKFSPSDGTLKAVRALKGLFSVTGCRTGSEWTRRALRRVGLNAVEETTDAEATIAVLKRGEGYTITLEKGSMKREFNTVAALVSFLRSANYHLL